MPEADEKQNHPPHLGALHFIGVCLATSWGAALALYLSVGPAEAPGGGVMDEAKDQAFLGAWFLLVFVPGLAAFVLRHVVSGEGPSFGWPTRRWPAYLYAWVLPAVFLAFCFGLAWLVGDAGPAPELVEAREQLLQDSSGSAMTVLLFYMAVLVPFVVALLLWPEEYGWRGFLLPRLLELGPVPAVFLQGFLWSVWHLPFFLLMRPYGGVAFYLAVPCAVLALGLLGSVLGVLALRDRSVWVSALAQSVAFTHLGVWSLFLEQQTPILWGPLGLVGILTCCGFLAWALHRGWAHLPP